MIGSRFAAFAAGRMPNTTPTTAEKPSASATAHHGVYAGGKPGMNDAASAPIAVAEREADQAAEQAQHERLEQELQQDVMALRADGLADADLARPLRHGHEHDVHDADAADEQRDADDAAHDDRHGVREFPRTVS